MHLLLFFRCYKANSLIQTKAQSFTGSFFIWRHFANQVPRNRAKTTASSTCVTHNHHLADCQAIKRNGSRQMQHTVSLWLIIAPYRNLVWLLMHSCDSIPALTFLESQRTVAVPPDQHSPAFGQRASWHTLSEQNPQSFTCLEHTEKYYLFNEWVMSGMSGISLWAKPVSLMVARTSLYLPRSNMPNLVQSPNDCNTGGFFVSLLLKLWLRTAQFPLVSNWDSPSSAFRCRHDQTCMMSIVNGLRKSEALRVAESRLDTSPKRKRKEFLKLWDSWLMSICTYHVYIHLM